MNKTVVSCLAAALALWCCFALGCSSGSQASSSAATTSSASASAASATASSDSASSSFSGAAASASASASASADDFDRAVVGSWHIYSADFKKNDKKNIDRQSINRDETALLRRFGLNVTMTLFSDGTGEMKVGNDMEDFVWEETGYNELLVSFKDGEESYVFTLASGRLTMHDEDGTEIVFSKG